MAWATNRVRSPSLWTGLLVPPAQPSWSWYWREKREQISLLDKYWRAILGSQSVCFCLERKQLNRWCNHARHSSLKTCIYFLSYSNRSAQSFYGLYKFPNKAWIPLPLCFQLNNNSLSLSLSLSLSIKKVRNIQNHSTLNSKFEGFWMAIWAQYHHLLALFLLTWASTVPTNANMEGKHGVFIWAFFKVSVPHHLLHFLLSVGLFFEQEMPCMHWGEQWRTQSMFYRAGIQLWWIPVHGFMSLVTQTTESPDCK